MVRWFAASIAACVVSSGVALQQSVPAKPPESICSRAAIGASGDRRQQESRADS